MNVLLWIQACCLSSLFIVVILYRIEWLSFKLFSVFFALPILVWFLTGLILLGRRLIRLYYGEAFQLIDIPNLSLSFLVLILLFVFVKNTKRYPLIHDITTDFDTPPAFINAKKLRRLDDNSLIYNTEVIRKQQKAYPYLEPLITDLSYVEAFAYAQRTAQVQGWVIVFVDKELGVIEATDRSDWFGFVDDIVIRVRQKERGVQIDLRSVSRVGKGDLGANALRIQQFFLAFKVELKN